MGEWEAQNVAVETEQPYNFTLIITRACADTVLPSDMYVQVMHYL